MDYMGNLEIKREKQEAIFDTSKNMEKQTELNKTVDYIKLADEQEMLSKQEMEKEAKYNQLAEDWEKRINGEDGGVFAKATSYAQVVRSMDRLLKSGKVTLEKSKQEVIRRSAKAFFAKRQIKNKLSAQEYECTHEKLEENEEALLDSWRVRGDSTEMKNLKDSIRTLRRLRNSAIVVPNMEQDAVDTVLDKKRTMDEAVDDVIKKCRIYMKHVGDPGSDAGKKRLALASDILAGLQMQKNTSDSLSFDRTTVLKGMATFPLGIDLTWHDLVEYMLRADDIMKGGSEKDMEESAIILNYLEADCPAEAQQKKGSNPPLIPGLKVKTVREVVKTIGKSAGCSLNKKRPVGHQNVTSTKKMGEASQKYYAANDTQKEGYFYNEFTEKIIMTISDEEFLNNDDKLESIGVTADQIPFFRDDMKKLINQSDVTWKIMDQAIGSCTLINNFFAQGFSIKDRENKGNADDLMTDIQKSTKREFYENTENYYKESVNQAALKGFVSELSALISKYRIDVGKVYRDNELAFINPQFDDYEKRKKKVEQDYEKDKPYYDEVLNELDSKEAVPVTAVTIGGVSYNIAQMPYFDTKVNYSAVNLSDEQQQELSRLITEYNTVANKAYVYTDMRNRMVDARNSYDTDAAEVGEFDLFRKNYDKIEEQYGNTPEYRGILEDINKDIEDARENGTYKEKFVLSHLEDIYGESLDKMKQVTYVFDEKAEADMRQWILNKVPGKTLNALYNDAELDAKGDVEYTVPKDMTLNTLIKAFRSFYNNRIRNNTIRYTTKIVTQYNEANRGTFNFGNAFKKAGKVNYSDEFVNRNAKWLVNGHGTRNCYRFDLWNKQMHYTEQATQLGKKISGMLKK